MESLGLSVASNSPLVRRLDARSTIPDPLPHPGEERRWDRVEVCHDAGIEECILFGRRHRLELGGSPDLVGHETKGSVEGAARPDTASASS